ncbi:MAG: hypothetical protein ACOYKN_08645 [Pirellula sp.]|jgi:hypothetical protein|nr:MAG: hypothetical protein DWH99_15285 [Planctomycetota bacterium]
MPANIVAIADAITAELNGNAFSQPFTAQRQYLPIYDLKSMSELKVTVVPKGLVSSSLDRSRDNFDYQIDVGIQKKTQNQIATIDALMLLVEQISDYFRSNPLSSYPGARFISVENTPIYAPDHLETMLQFTSVLTLTYRLVR